MRKIILLLFLVLAIKSYSQLIPPEGFEATWTSGGPVNWNVYQNTIGTSQKWRQTVLANNTVEFVHSGSYAAFVNQQNGPNGSIPPPQDWLVTPVFNLPANPQLRFWSRLGFNGDSGGIYRILILDMDAFPVLDPAQLSSYVEVIEWTETALQTAQQSYTEITVTTGFPEALIGHQVRIAFLMEGDEADRWMIDDVSLESICPPATDLAVSDLQSDSATLDWSGNIATQWEVEVRLAAEVSTGEGVAVSGSPTLSIDNLIPDSYYKFFVRPLCSPSNPGIWAGPYTFKTRKTGDSCEDPILINTLPYAEISTTGDHANVYTGAGGQNCGIPGDYLQGNDVVYSYTAVQDGVISIKLKDISDNYASVLVYTSCDAIGSNCYAAASNLYSMTDLTINPMSVTAGTTYYIVVSSWYPPFIDYNLIIQEENCAIPSGLSSTTDGTGSTTLDWEENGEAVSWEYYIQPAGGTIPLVAGTTVGGSSSATVTGLPESTMMEFYIRSACGDGSYSSWAGPVSFNTPCGILAVPFQEGFNTDSETEFCWTIADNNNDGTLWDTNLSYNTFEGDQVAQFSVSGSSSHDDMLISPRIMLSGNQRLKFNYMTSYEPVEARLMVSVTGTNPEDFTIELSPLTQYKSEAYTEKTINLSSLPSGPVYIAWHIPPGAAPGYTLYIDNVRIEEQPACAEPNDAHIDIVTYNSVNVSWLPGDTETQWQVVIQPHESGIPAEDAGQVVTAPNYSQGELSADTPYEFYVRSLCDGSGNSPWIGPIPFTTLCSPLNVPFMESFDTDSTTQHCWHVNNIDNDGYTWNLEYGPNPYEGDKAAYFSQSATNFNDWLISPPINLTGNQRLKFYHNGLEGQTSFKVLLSTTGRNPEDFTEVLLPFTTYDNADYIKKIISLQQYTGVVYIAWQITPETPYGGNLYLDNVLIEDIPSCPEPINLAVQNIEQSSVQLSWDTGETETEWEIFIKLFGSSEPPGQGIITSNNPYMASFLPDGTALQPGTAYEYYVRAVCDEENSIWSDPYKFVTAISNDECDNAVNVPVNSDHYCTVYASGTVIGATPSPQENTCGMWVDDDDDVWFSFTAISSLHTVDITNINGSDSTLMAAIYSGNCNNSIPIGECQTFADYDEYSTAVLNELTIGQTYYIKIFTPYNSGPTTTTFNICIKTPVVPIIVDTELYTVEELVREVLVDTACDQISNITWSTGSNYDSVNGIGYFTNNEGAFPFESGIVLTTGDVMKAPGPNYGPRMGEGAENWPGDNDLEQIIPMISRNATVLEFDFVPLSPGMSFDFLFASEEYGQFQCYFSDAFAFILTDQEGNSQNLALIPDTTTPVSVVTVRDQQYNSNCPSVNPEFFGDYYFAGNEAAASINFNGTTVKLTAAAIVVPGQQYHIKLVIADRDDVMVDSAVFLRAGSFNIGSPDLGTDLLTETNNAVCANDTVTIHTGLNADLCEITWYINNVIIEGETGVDLEVSVPGVYKAIAKYPVINCELEDEVIVQFYPEVGDMVQDPANLTVCDATGFASFDLTQNTILMLSGTQPGRYVVTYHASEESAQTGAEILPVPYINTIQFQQTLYARIYDTVTKCYGIAVFDLIIQDLTPDFTLEGNLSLCMGSTGTLTVVPINYEHDEVVYSWSFNGNPINITTPFLTISEAGTYEVTVDNSGCIAITETIVTVTPVPVADMLDNVTQCEPYILPELSAGNSYYTGQGGTGLQLFAGEQVNSNGIIYILAENNSCTDESSFDVFIGNKPLVIFEEGCEDKGYVLKALPGDGSFDPDLVEYSWTGPESFTASLREIVIAKAGIYTVIVKTPEGCSGAYSYNVTTTGCSIPKGISPNGDGLNDNFDLTGFDVQKLTIFNRYGQQVYTKFNYRNEWQGQQDNGNELPTGTYYYSVELAGGEKRTGWIYINRK